MLTTFVASVALLITALMAYLGLALARRAVAAPACPSSLPLHAALPAALRARQETSPASSVSRLEHGRAADLTRQDAEDLLDWLEATGHGTGELSYDGNGFTVVW